MSGVNVSVSRTEWGADRNWFALYSSQLDSVKQNIYHNDRTISAIRYPDGTYGVSISMEYEASVSGIPIARSGSATIHLPAEEMTALINAQVELSDPAR